LRAHGRARSETPYRATVTIHYLAPDFGVAAGGWLVVEEFVDAGRLGPRVGRLGAQQVVEAARLRRFD
jgi:hypothetical protein